ncbi:rod shape-determining protein MreC [Desulfobacterota bacterium AH_259_B03_O07]|nr:rod shape-determining protein MreC [Desulfobacterota bacterium AH_259_B03_O07]
MGFLRRHPILISIILLILAIQVSSLYINDKQVENPFSRSILNLNYYPQKFIHSVTGRIVTVWENYIDLIDTKKENLKLRLENQKLRQKTIEISEVKLQNERLRKLLQFKEYTTHKTVTANVIAGSPSLLRTEVVIIDKGAESGITEGMPVASYDGIVGRIHLVGDKNSEVILITDPLSAVDAYIHRTRARGIVKGTGNSCVMDYIENNTDISNGDKVISSGKDGFFPKGVLIGTVDNIEQKGGFLSAHVSPNVELKSLEEVLVILKKPGNIAFNE